MIPVIDNVPMLILVIVLTIPVAILSMRLAEKVCIRA
jgi:peptidoglycan/LPS O-acetylase OafA/YrhL